jgi:radical SAM superfamily enzyme YgiQ (UPF0313 family)
MIKRAMEMAALVKKTNPGTLIVLGGPHPSFAPEETLEPPDVDAVVIGEGEETFPRIVERFLGGSRDFSGIKGSAFKDPAGEIFINPPGEMIKDLDSIPFPSIDIMAVETYFNEGSKYGVLQRRSRSLPIIASRGCPSDCTFCVRFLGRRFRVRGAENIVDELAWLKEGFGVKEFNFLDDNFTLHKKRVMEVCDLIHRRGLDITFRFPNGVREDFLDGDILRVLKSVGCYHLDFGIESGSQRVLNLMKKGKKIEEIAEKVYLCKEHGFKVSASFLFGTPGETLEDMEKTIRFAAALPLDSASFGIVIPFPGTELRKEAIEKGLLLHSDYEYYNIGLVHSRPPIETPEWSAEDLISILKKANRSFFLSPGRVMRLLPTMLNPVSLKRYMSSLYQVLRG